MSSELAIRVLFFLLLCLFSVGFGHSGTEHPTGYQVESPSVVHCSGVHFFLSRHSLVHLSTFILISLDMFSSL